MSKFDVTPVDVLAGHMYDGHNFNSFSFSISLLFGRFVCYFTSIFTQNLFS